MLPKLMTLSFLFFACNPSHSLLLILPKTAMTKRTASIAAAKAAAKNYYNGNKKKRLTAVSKATIASTDTATTNSSGRSTDSSNEEETVPWYTVYTKGDAEYNTYMATEWGFEKRGDVPLFEKLCLEGAQSGLSWLTILRKREAYRKVFHQFDVQKVAQMTEADIQAILDTTSDNTNEVVVRHRGKIEATIHNAKCVQEMHQEEDRRGKKSNNNSSDEKNVLDKFLWSFVQNKPILNTTWKQGESLSSAPTKTQESEAMSKALKKRGFKFVGPTTCYALMQSTGMVIDHPVGSPEWVSAKERLEKRPDRYQLDTDSRELDTRSDLERDNKNDSKKKGAKKTASSTTNKSAPKGTAKKRKR